MSAPADHTRLLLSELAPSVTTQLLKQHVASSPVDASAITDAKVLTKSDGTSRRLAFVGCKTHAAATALKDWLDGTWLQGSTGGARVRVNWAKDTHDAARPRKRARLADTSASLTPPSHTASKGPSNPKNDDRFDQFMSVMAPKRGRALEQIREPELVVSAPTAPVAQDEQASSDVSQRLHTQTPQALDASPSVLRDDGAAHDDTISDSDYLARRMKRTLSDANPDSKMEWSQENEGVTDASLAGDGKSDEAQAASSNDNETLQDPQIALASKAGRLFCRNLAFSVEENDLRQLFEPYGLLDEASAAHANSNSQLLILLPEQVHVVRDKITNRSKGLAYVSFRVAKDAGQAMHDLDGRTFQGRLLHILPSSEKREHSQQDAATSVKRARLAAKKADSGNAMSWATLYMNSDAVVSSIADRLGISKAELLDPTSSNAAVRVALAETHVIAETRKFFEDEGINVEALGVGGPRSSTTIMIKNIPHGTSDATIRALFEPFGHIVRLLLAPAGTMAVIEYENASESADAWRALAYKKVGGSVLFLEKAPAAIWTSSDRGQTPAQDAKQNSSLDQLNPVSADEEKGAPGATLFVKNIAFATSEAAFRKIFDHLPEFAFARLKTKPNPKVAGSHLSMGFGFVGFKSPAAASAALKARNGLMLDGHQLQIRFAERGREQDGISAQARVENKLNSTKLVIKNVPFEVTSKEIRELVSAYGTVRSVRLPRKFDRKTRGFAFLDFASHQDAKSTLSALQHTHLLGRHLVVQWAEEDMADVENLRKKSSLPGQKPIQRTKFVLDH
ncbi:Multiple RNA-binding domain-containing protein 1 [Microbotryomycetes sp. JL201]|nr:Multiple RNA-binding domain-containing protein 1 [Microbotryomycetes sp. JL201]